LGTGFDVRVVTGMETTVWEVTRGVEINADAVQLSDRRTNTMRYNTIQHIELTLISAPLRDLRLRPMTMHGYKMKCVYYYYYYFFLKN